MEEEPNRSTVRDLKFSRDRSKLAVARESDQVEMWTVSDVECRWATEMSVGSSTLLAFSADESKLACKDHYQTIVLDAESGEECNSEDTFDFESTYDHVHIAYVS